MKEILYTQRELGLSFRGLKTCFPAQIFMIFFLLFFPINSINLLVIRIRSVIIIATVQSRECYL